jgi:fumarylacetoacetate (FAA) hydrolase
MDTVREIEQKIVNSGISPDSDIIKLVSPIPNPPSCRDAYAFRQHVESARRNRGVEMIPEFDEYPIFYFTNHNAIFGEGDIWVEKDHLEKLDFELEWAAVIGKRGKNISSDKADEYIAGFTIMNDLSARLLQMEEMKLNLGPAKGKDFATTLGPYLVTPDELEDYKISTPFGNQYKLKMEAYHNGVLISSGNTADMTWTFAEIIERVSYGVAIRPGEVIGSGTVGTGCYLELNGTRARIAKEMGEDYTPVWLQPNDEITLKIDMLGTLTNRIVYSNSDHSILAKKK